MFLPAFITREGCVLRQRLDNEVKTEPQTPTVMIERDRDNEGHDEQHHQHTLVIRAQNQQTKEADQQDCKLRRHHVRENCADEKPVFALEQRHAGRAVMADAERVRENLRLTTHGTQQPQTTTQYQLDLLEIFYHYPPPSYPADAQQTNPQQKPPIEVS